MKIGHSFDIHRFGEKRDLILGGIKVDHDIGLIGHSDADVLLHAITEAIIGALSLGDIGTLFPDTDEKYKNVDSMILLKEVIKIMKEKGYKINNIDATILLEKPNLKNYKQLMKVNIANSIGVEEDQVNIKATRGEKLGFIGRSEGIASEAVVLLEKYD